MDGGAWWATANRVAKSQTRLSDFTFTLILMMQFVKQHKSIRLLHIVQPLVFFLPPNTLDSLPCQYTDLSCLL